MTVLKVSEVATLLRVSRTCVYDLVKSGKLRSFSIGNGRGAIRISHDDLTSFMEACRKLGNATASVPSHSVELRHLTQ